MLIIGVGNLLVSSMYSADSDKIRCATCPPRPTTNTTKCEANRNEMKRNETHAKKKNETRHSAARRSNSFCRSPPVRRHTVEECSNKSTTYLFLLCCMPALRCEFENNWNDRNTHHVLRFVSYKTLTRGNCHTKTICANTRRRFQVLHSSLLPRPSDCNASLKVIPTSSKN